MHALAKGQRWRKAPTVAKASRKWKGLRLSLRHTQLPRDPTQLVRGDCFVCESKQSCTGKKLSTSSTSEGYADSYAALSSRTFSAESLGGNVSCHESLGKVGAEGREDAAEGAREEVVERELKASASSHAWRHLEVIRNLLSSGRERLSRKMPSSAKSTATVLKALTENPATAQSKAQGQCCACAKVLQARKAEHPGLMRLQVRWRP